MTRYYFSVGRTHTTWDYMQLVDTVLYRNKHFTSLGIFDLNMLENLETDQ